MTEPGKEGTAIMHALDREALADALTFSSGRATGQVFASSSPLNIKAY